MTKWEYLLIVPGGTSPTTRVQYVNERELPNWKHGPPTMDYVNALGERGWELVVGSAPGYTGSAWIFKRPKP